MAVPKRRPVRVPKRTVALTEAQWRAVAAMLYVSANVSTTNLEQRTLFYTIYDEVARQINFVPQPIDDNEDENTAGPGA